MWPYGQHYHVESIDVKRRSFDCGIMVDFKKSSWASSKDKNIIEGNLQYVRKIQEISELDYRSLLAWMENLGHDEYDDGGGVNGNHDDENDVPESYNPPKACS